MDNFKLVENKIKDLIAECHEHGMQYLVSVMDDNAGNTINAIEGKGSTAIIMMGLFVKKLSEAANISVEEVMSHIKSAVDAAIEVDKEMESKSE